MVFGGAWTEGDVAVVQRALGGAEGVVMMRKDGSRPGPPPGPEYGAHIVGRVKSALGRVVDGEEVDGPGEGVVWY